MTREEIKAWGQHMADKVFHKKHKKLKLEGKVISYSTIIAKNEGLTIKFNTEFFENTDFNINEPVEIIIKNKY